MFLSDDPLIRSVSVHVQAQAKGEGWEGGVDPAPETGHPETVTKLGRKHNETYVQIFTWSIVLIEHHVCTLACG